MSHSDNKSEQKNTNISKPADFFLPIAFYKQFK